MAMAPSFDVAGWFANGPGVFRKVGPVLLEGAHVRLRQSSTLIVLDDAFAEADADVARLLNAALAAMAAELPGPTHATHRTRGPRHLARGVPHHAGA